MADNHLVRVAAGWLKWDKDHFKWQNVEESAASKNHVLKRVKSCVTVSATSEPSTLLKKRAKPLEAPKNAKNKALSKKLPVAKNKFLQLPKHNSLVYLGNRPSANMKENLHPPSIVPQSAAPLPSNKSCDTDDVPSTSLSCDDMKMTTDDGHLELTGHQSSKQTNGSILPIEERMLRDHSAMTNILSSRLLHLNAAATLWRQCGSGALVSYLLKVNDDSVTVDVLPVLVYSLSRQGNCQSDLSVEICFDLQPLIKQLLHSKYEDYIVNVLSFLDAVFHCWDDRQQDGHQLASSSLQAFVQDISESVLCLFQQDSRIYNKVKKLDNYMKQLVLKHCTEN